MSPFSHQRPKPREHGPFFFLPSFVLYFPTRKSTGTPTRDQGPRIWQGSRFLLRQCATWEFRPDAVIRVLGRLWLVGRGAHVVFICFVLKKAGFCTIEARILGQDRLTYCAAFSNLGVGVSRKEFQSNLGRGPAVLHLYI